MSLGELNEWVLIGNPLPKSPHQQGNFNRVPLTRVQDGSWLTGCIGTRGWSQERHRDKMSRPARAQRPRSPLQSRSITVFLGSGPNRGRSPVEWGDFPSVRTFVRTFIRTSVPPLGHPASQPSLMPNQPSLRPSQSGLRLRQPARPEAQTASQA